MNHSPIRAAVRLLPLLLLYGAVTLTDATEHLTKDEPTYVTYALGLLQGWYAPPGSEFLWCGPGYPLVLAVLHKLGLPLLAAKLLNGVFLYSALLLFQATAAMYVSRRKAFWSTCALGVYWPIFDELGFMMTESFTFFLISLTLWLSCRAFRHEGRAMISLAVAAASLAYLALTKIVFGWVLLTGLVLCLAIYLVNRRRVWRRAWIVCALAIGLCSPYLIYTHQLTGQFYCWGTSGGLQLYWMSSPYEDEYGDWINYVNMGRANAANSPAAARFMERHGELISDAFGYEGYYEQEPFDKFILRLGTRQDSMLMARAIDNISSHPIKYVRNWVANVSRMLVGAPFSYQAQSPKFLKYAIPNAVLVLLGLVTIVVIALRIRDVRDEVLVLCGFAALYLVGSSLLSAYPRQFYVMVPVLLWAIVVVLDSHLRIGLRQRDGHGDPA